jgi:hypothetical protein
LAYFFDIPCPSVEGKCPKGKGVLKNFRITPPHPLPASRQVTLPSTEGRWKKFIS